LGALNNPIYLGESGAGTLQATGDLYAYGHKIYLGPGGGTVDTNGYQVHIATIDPGDFVKAGAGVLTTPGMVVNALTINAGTLQIDPRSTTGQNNPARMTTLNIASGASLDLNDNDLVVNNGVFSSIRALVLAGYSSTPNATKTGIISTTGQNSGKTILALFDNALVSPHLTDWPKGSGQTIATNAVVGKYTYFGDATLDGQVTADDYLVLDANRNTTPPVGLAWIRGDMTNDGHVTADDYLVLDANRGLGVGSPLAAAAVPEPATAALALGAAGLLAGRRRRS